MTADPFRHPTAAIDPRAIHRLHPFVDEAVAGQPDPVGVRAAIRAYGLAVTVTEDEVPLVVASVFDNAGQPHPIATVPAHAVGLHRVDEYVVYLADPVIDA